MGDCTYNFGVTPVRGRGDATVDLGFISMTQPNPMEQTAKLMI